MIEFIGTADSETSTISDHLQVNRRISQAFMGRLRKKEVPDTHSPSKSRIIWKPKFKLEYAGVLQEGAAVPDPVSGGYLVRLYCKLNYGFFVRRYRAKKMGFRDIKLNISAAALLKDENKEPLWIRSVVDYGFKASDFPSQYGTPQTIHNFVKYIESDGLVGGGAGKKGGYLTETYRVGHTPPNKWLTDSGNIQGWEGGRMLFDIVFQDKYNTGLWKGVSYAPFFVFYWVTGSHPASGSKAEQIGPTITRVYVKRLKFPSIIPVGYNESEEWGVR